MARIRSPPGSHFFSFFFSQIFFFTIFDFLVYKSRKFDEFRLFAARDPGSSLGRSDIFLCFFLSLTSHMELLDYKAPIYFEINIHSSNHRPWFDSWKDQLFLHFLGFK